MLKRMTASNRKISWKRHLSCAALACALALACASGPALAADDDEEDSFETKIIKGILGINDRDSIDYRQRPPLVVPPSRNLPPPETTATVANPAWPKDPEIAEKKKRKAAAREQRRTVEEEGRPLTPAELDRGRKAGAGRVTDARPGDAVFEGGRPLRPPELGYKGGLLDSIWKGEKDEAAVFTGEPQRTDLTQPPAGYMTPSPSHPYGLSPKKEAAKPYNAHENRGTEQAR